MFGLARESWRQQTCHTRNGGISQETGGMGRDQWVVGNEGGFWSTHSTIPPHPQFLTFSLSIPSASSGAYCLISSRKTTHCGQLNPHPLVLTSACHKKKKPAIFFFVSLVSFVHHIVKPQSRHPGALCECRPPITTSPRDTTPKRKMKSAIGDADDPSPVHQSIRLLTGRWPTFFQSIFSHRGQPFFRSENPTVNFCLRVIGQIDVTCLFRKNNCAFHFSFFLFVSCTFFSSFIKPSSIQNPPHATSSFLQSIKLLLQLLQLLQLLPLLLQSSS